MQKTLLKNGITFAVIVLFIVACFVPSISGNFETNNKDKSHFSPFSDEKIDQQQPLWNGIGIGCASPHMLAQSFKPTLNTLTKVELLVDNWYNLLSAHLKTILIVFKSNLFPDCGTK